MVQATDSAGNSDLTPATYTWSINSTSADTTITGASTNSVSASFSFTGSVSGSTFSCRLDGASYSVCTSPKSYSSLTVGSHTFEVRATDPGGNVDASPASHEWAATAPPATPVPNGPPGAWTLGFQDEFNGSTLDTAKWDPHWYLEGGSQNNTPTYARNVTVANGELVLRLANEGGTITGASVNTQGNDGYQVMPGEYAEARVYFPGEDVSQPIYNFPAWWISGTPWPSAGEHDIAEGLGGNLTVNYHSPSGSHNQGTIPGDWNNAFHTYGVHRKATSADVYWDGKFVKSYQTDDNGGGENLILNIGRSSSRTPVTGAAGAVRVDYVRAWRS
jgi:hypothetical protein